MNKRAEYLLAIMPSSEISNLVKDWKQLLKKEIGRFGSDNLLAHITVMSFDADLNQLQNWIKQISNFCNNYPKHEISFEGFALFDHHTFYIKPDKVSMKHTNMLIRNLHRYFNFKIKNVKSHMTIARELDKMKTESASKLFENHKTDFKFLCEGFTLRKFNESTGQYSDFIAEFKFSEQQLKLF